MNRRPTPISDRAGFTLLELLIALFLMGIVITVVFRVFVAQHHSTVTQDQVTTVQQNARAAIDELSRHIRMAGFDLPLGVPAIALSNTNPDTITVTYRADDCETYLSATMSMPNGEISCGSDVSCFDTGQWVYIFEPDSGGGEWFSISAVVTGSNKLQHASSPLSKCYAKDAIVVALTQVKYFIDTSDAEKPVLMIQLPGRTPQIYAQHISDLQFQYRMKNGMILEAPVLVSDIREVLISITGRSENPEYEMDIDITGSGDQYRYRSYATSVYLRNIGS